jgi:hypothetical protein
METVKLHVHSVVSDHRKDHTTAFMTADIHDFYLGAPLPRAEYIRIAVKKISAANIEKYSLSKFIQKNAVLFRVDKCLWGLPQAGLLSQQRLVAHLALHGYRQVDANVPCYFKHDSNSASFTLVVDDFGIKYTRKEDAQHLLDTICMLYPSIKVDWSGSKYLGFQLDWNYSSRPSVSLSMPNYIPKALERFSPGKVVRGASSPAVYTTFWNKNNKQPQRVLEDTSPKLSAEKTKLLQQIVGTYLFYARAVDCTMLTAVNHIASMGHTANALAAANRLIAYSASYPNHKVTFRACDMILYVQSDASYLTRSNSRSVAGGLAYLGNKGDTFTINGPVACMSTIIKNVCSSPTESEYAMQHGI